MAYLPLSTANLPDPVIDPAQGASPEDYFNTVLYTGTGAAQSITGVGHQPDFTWIKARSIASGHGLIDAVRGRSKVMYSNATLAEETSGSTEDLTSFDSDGFSLGTNGRFASNSSGETFVAWNWKANGSGVTNNVGSITSTVSANTTSGFSIATFTGTGATSETVGHGLNSTPELVIAKRRDNVSDWFVYSKEFPDASYYMYLNSTAAQAVYNPFWNSTAPTSSVFTIGSIFGSGGTYVAYCFHSVEGFSKFGSYVGNGSTDGPFVYTGFRPSWILIKQSSASGERWWLHDTAREEYNGDIAALAPDFSGAEETGTVYQLDTLSNGFKLRNSHAVQNSSGATYIYACFSENPFKYSNAR